MQFSESLSISPRSANMNELFSTPARITPLRQGPPIFVVSGSTGATGELLARTVLAQFPDVHVPLEIERRVVTVEQIRTIIARAAEFPGAIILHTMVNQTFRHLLIEEASIAGVMTFDLSGPLQEHLSLELDMQPLGQPGRFHQINRAYFDRVQAIEFTVSHDDGQRVEDLAQAEIVLLGVSRVGKTPLSMYLSVMGWKVANVPMTPPVTPPPELLKVDRRPRRRTDHRGGAVARPSPRPRAAIGHPRGRLHAVTGDCGGDCAR
jgi:regulator of PEP synthase PpsR (kinase-PPPase family)